MLKSQTEESRKYGEREESEGRVDGMGGTVSVEESENDCLQREIIQRKLTISDMEETGLLDRNMKRVEA